MSSAFSAAPDGLVAGRLPRGGSSLARPQAPVQVQALRFLRLLRNVATQWHAAARRVPRVSCQERHALMQRQSRDLLDALDIRIVVRGMPPALSEPALIVANHISWLDPYAINCVSGARFVAKSEVAHWPVVGRVARGFGTFFHRRGNFRCAARVKDRLARTLRGGEPVAFFPEGTTTTGGTPKRFFPALFQAAVDAGVTVQPVAIRYRGSDGRNSTAAAYVGDMSILDSVRHLIAQGTITVELTFGAPIQCTSGNRRELAERAHGWIAAVLHLATIR